MSTRLQRDRTAFIGSVCGNSTFGSLTLLTTVLVRPHLGWRQQTHFVVLRNALRRERESAMRWMARSNQSVRLKPRRRHTLSSRLHGLLVRNKPKGASRLWRLVRFAERRQLPRHLLSQELYVVRLDQRQTVLVRQRTG